MRDINELVRQKEQRIQQLRKEIEALRVAAPLLGGQGETGPELVPAGHAEKVDIASYLNDANS
jgi:hypothetical protein